jgi:type II secretory pathway pseudopilin PulG
MANGHDRLEAYPTRRGVTIIEVLFAIGIVIVGLMGVASLLPLAARNAQVSNEANEGQAYAQRYYAEFVSRGFNKSENWRWFDDNPAFGNKSFANFINSAVVRSTGGAVGDNVSTPNRHAICIDPGFYADPLTLLESASYVFDDTQNYRVGLFPYYHDKFNPARNPNSLAVLASPPALVNRPRLLRVGLHDPASTRTLIPAKVVQALFNSLDDLATTKPKDRSLPATRISEPLTTAGLPGRGATQARYSWLATLCPREFGAGETASARQERFYTLSIVVMHRRDRAWFAPTGSDKNEIPQGERLLGVTPQSGNFIGGDGGRVTVNASTGIDDNIRIGDWMMFSRYQNGDIANRGVICRWYRVVGIDTDTIFTGGSPPTGWSRNVVLEGPDWVFDELTPPLGVPADDLPTQATLLTNAVTVFERIIPVE